MSKTNKLDFESKIISQIKADEIKMKPKWYFILGSLLLFTSLVGLSMGVVFLVNLSAFLIRRNGSFNAWKLQSILSVFPWWIPVIAVGGIFLSIWLLKKYDLSYKKNFKLIIAVLVIAMLMGGFLLDRLGLNEYLSRGRMRRYYQQFEMQNINNYPTGGRGQNNKQINNR